MIQRSDMIDMRALLGGGAYSRGPGGAAGGGEKGIARRLGTAMRAVVMMRRSTDVAPSRRGVATNSARTR